MKRPRLALFCAGLALLLVSCASSETEETEEAPGTNALREYVNTPKDKARAAGRAINRQQNQTADQARQLVDE